MSAAANINQNKERYLIYSALADKIIAVDWNVYVAIMGAQAYCLVNKIDCEYITLGEI